MSSQNRFLLPSTSSASSGGASNTTTTSNSRAGGESSTAGASHSDSSRAAQPDNQLSVDTDFDSYWEEEARNPHRNRIRIGRQYQATVPPILKTGDKDCRKLDELETLSFCPKKSARVSDAELDHYFTVAKSLNLFASLVETRSLLGRDVTIADLNFIRRKEGLSLASVIQPVRQQVSATPSTNVANNPQNVPSQQSANNTNQTQATSTLLASQQSSQKSLPTNCDNNRQQLSSSSSSSLSSPNEQHTSIADSYAFNQPLMKALSHFINLHHPCHHDRDCKRLLKDVPLEDDLSPTVSITAGNLRQGSSSSTAGPKESKPGRSRSSLKQAAAAAQAPAVKDEQPDKDQQQDDQQQQQLVAVGGDTAQSPNFDDWTREEVELFSKAIEVCGKNFSSIKKEFLPSKSVKSIVEYYYIGSRDVSESKKKSTQPVETSDGCSSPEKSMANNNSHGGSSGGGSGSSTGGKSGSSSNVTGSSNSAASSSRTPTNSNNDSNNPTKALSDSNEETKQTSSSNRNDDFHNKALSNSKGFKTEIIQDSNGIKSKTKNIDPRMSVYNFDEEFKEDSPVRFDCPRLGAEVRPLKAKPITSNASLDSDPTNSNVGSLKFFMDGQLVLKLNACQEQQEGIEKCHWVQSGDKVINANRQKRYIKRAERLSDSNQNGSQSNSVVSSYQDDDSKNDDLTGDEDSKESMNSFTNLPQQKNNHGSPVTKRQKIKAEPITNQQQQHFQQQNQLQQLQGQQSSSPINYNRLAVNNRMKERNDLNPSPVINQAMPWLQANSFAVAAALLGGLPFPPATGNMIVNPPQNNMSTVNMPSKPMDLSLEHSSPKPIQKSSRSSRGSRSRNN